MGYANQVGDGEQDPSRKYYIILAAAAGALLLCCCLIAIVAGIIMVTQGTPLMPAEPTAYMHAPTSAPLATLPSPAPTEVPVVVPTTSVPLPPESPEIGYTAPDFTLEGMDGNMYRLSDFRGQPVLINIWASWCPPCRDEMPYIQTVYDRHHGEGLVVLAIDATNDDTRADAKDWINDNGFTYPVLFDDNGDVMQLYWIDSYPRTFFVDSTGVITQVQFGSADEAFFESEVLKILP